MEIILENLKRSFGQQTVIRDLNFRFQSGESYAVLGGNGSGKSTILRIIYGALTPSGGKLNYLLDSKPLKSDEVPFRISIAGPYLELIEELTALEFLQFYFKFRKPIASFDPERVLQYCMLEEASAKQIKNFSSGMKQRLRIGLAFLSSSDLILLDEPTSNLDAKGIEWYRQTVAKHQGKRTLIIGSNHQAQEIDFCTHQLEEALWR